MPQINTIFIFFYMLQRVVLFIQHNNHIIVTLMQQKIISIPSISKSNIKSSRIVTSTFRKGGPRMEYQSIGDKHIFHNYGLGSDEAILGYGSSSIVEKMLSMKVQPRYAGGCAIIGAGIAGLFTALQLLKNGQRVTIYSQNFHELQQKTKPKSSLVPRIFMPNHYDWEGDPLKHELISKISYDYLKESVKVSRYQSVRNINSYDLIHSKEELKEVVSQYIYDSFEQGNVRVKGRGIQKSVNYSTILVDTALLLQELRVEIVLRGGKLIQKKINSESDMIDLKENFIFNCITSSSSYLFNDKELEQKTQIVLELQVKSQPQEEFVLTAKDEKGEIFDIYSLRRKTYIAASTLSLDVQASTSQTLKKMANFINRFTLLPTL